MRPPRRPSRPTEPRRGRAGRIGGRPLVVGVEAVAVDREDEAVFVDVAGGELQRGLQQFLQLILESLRSLICQDVAS